MKHKKHKRSGLAKDGDPGELLRASITRHGLEAEQTRAVGLFLLHDLFDLQKVTNLPPAFLEDFSWAPGQDGEFFAEGPFKGWPLRIWPIFKRPFIKLDGKHYCFDLSGLFDHFYRQLEKRVFADDQRLKQAWIDARKGVTETPRHLASGTRTTPTRRRLSERIETDALDLRPLAERPVAQPVSVECPETVSPGPSTCFVD